MQMAKLTLSKQYKCTNLGDIIVQFGSPTEAELPALLKMHISWVILVEIEP